MEGMSIKALLLIAVLLSPIHAQTPPPKFEVVSVKPLTNEYRGFLSYDCAPDGRFTNAGPLRSVLLWAYDIKGFQLVGVPSWDPTIMSDTTGLYRIEAKASGPVTQEVCKRMAQSLLEDRFKMVAHRESREMPAYALMVSKTGLKAQKAEAGKPGINFIPNGNPMGVARGGSADQRPGGWSMDTLAEMLGVAQLGKPVLNRTGLDGLYKINLNFSSDNLPEPRPGAGPDVRTALEEQMGLRLEAVKAPVEVVVIDRMEKPDAN